MAITTSEKSERISDDLIDQSFGQLTFAREQKFEDEVKIGQDVKLGDKIRKTVSQKKRTDLENFPIVRKPRSKNRENVSAEPAKKSAKISCSVLKQDLIKVDSFPSGFQNFGRTSGGLGQSLFSVSSEDRLNGVKVTILPPKRKRPFQPEKLVKT